MIVGAILGSIFAFIIMIIAMILNAKAMTESIETYNKQVLDQISMHNKALHDIKKSTEVIAKEFNEHNTKKCGMTQ